MSTSFDRISFHERDKLHKTEILAACIVRAANEYGLINHENDYYWTVRENCLEIAKSNGIQIKEVIKLSHDYVPSHKKDVEEIWPYVMHPFLLCKSVLEE